MKVRDIVKLVEKDGWVLKTIAGDHRQYVHPTKQGKVTIAATGKMTCHRERRTTY